MRNLLLVAGLAGVVATAACGNTGGRAPTAGDGGTGGGSGGFKPAAGKSGVQEGGGDGVGGSGEVAVDPLAPVVTITSPKAVDDPNEDGVLTGTEVEVVCTAKKSSEAGADEVDATTIKLQLLDAGGEVVEEKPGSPTTNEDEYSNTFVVIDYPAGALSFRCTARDRAGGHSGEDEISTLFDKGPLIKFLAPAMDASHPLQENLGIRFTVEAEPIADGDNGADVGPVTLSVAGKDIPLEGHEVSPGEYQLSVNLTAPPFETAPNGPIALTVQASNQREPNPVVRTTSRVVSIDGADPTVAFTSPDDGDVVGGEVIVEFTISDDVSGVDPDSVVVSLNQETYQFDQNDPAHWDPPQGNNFAFKFDSRQVTDNTQIIVNVTATDRVGNETDGAATLTIYLDNVPPWVDLDPLNVRTIKRTPLPQECSVSFDPVGEDAIDDEKRLSIPGTKVRVLAYEETNFVAGANRYFAGVKPGTVQFFVYKASEGPALVDANKDGSGACVDVPNPSGVNKVALDPIPASRTPKYGPAPGYPEVGPGGLSCELREEDTIVPTLCNGLSDMWQVIEHDAANQETQQREPVIYGQSVSAVGLKCTGDTFQMTTLVNGDGWVCLVGRAQDWAGNTGISPPLRVCFDDPRTEEHPTCNNLNEAPPSCTNGCTPPGHWQGGGLILE